MEKKIAMIEYKNFLSDKKVAKLIHKTPKPQNP